MKKQDELNKKRSVKVFEKGEVVFRRLPAFARPAKHLLGDRRTGPFIVKDQRSHQSVVLMDPATQTLIDGGRNIPLDLILAGPRRSKLAFDAPQAEVRGIGEMIRGEGAPPVTGLSTLVRGTGPRKGWAPLGRGAYMAYKTAATVLAETELTVGRVICNEKQEMRILVQPCRGIWQRVRATHHPEYLNPEGEETIEAQDHLEQEEVVRYAALVLEVEPYVGGELMHRCPRRLSDAGWGLKVRQPDQVACIRAMCQFA